MSVDINNWYKTVTSDDVIYLFKGPHERLEGTREEIIEQVRRTVVHEIGHYFGMDEEQIATMGYE